MSLDYGDPVIIEITNPRWVDDAKKKPGAYGVLALSLLGLLAVVAWQPKKKEPTRAERDAKFRRTYTMRKGKLVLFRPGQGQK